MTFLRNNLVSKVAALVVGVIFLNMSFFLAEVSMMKFEQRALVENIAKLIFNGGLEEERDGGSGSDGTERVDIHLQQFHVHHASSEILSSSINRNIINHYLHANYSLAFFQPPEQA